MSPDTMAKVINSCGLLFDIAGAWLVAWEVVHRYKGIHYRPTKSFVGITAPPQETNDFESWEKNKFIKMWIGLICLTVGFLMQFVSNWIH